MDYSKIYNSLISRAQQRPHNSEVIYEVHHILPRCIGGLDISENLVALTLREHFVAHQLLVKMYPDENKLIAAAWMMCSTRKRSSWKYEWLRKLRNVIPDIKIIEAATGSKTYREVCKRLNYKNPARVKKVLNDNGIFLHVTDETIINAFPLFSSKRQLAMALKTSEQKVNRVFQENNLSYQPTDKDIIQASNGCNSIAQIQQKLNYHQKDRIRKVLDDNNVELRSLRDLSEERIMKEAFGCSSYRQVALKMDYTNISRIKQVLNKHGVYFYNGKAKN